MQVDIDERGPLLILPYIRASNLSFKHNILQRRVSGMRQGMLTLPGESSTTSHLDIYICPFYCLGSPLSYFTYVLPHYNEHL